RLVPRARWVADECGEGQKQRDRRPRNSDRCERWQFLQDRATGRHSDRGATRIGWYWRQPMDLRPTRSPAWICAADTHLRCGIEGHVANPLGCRGEVATGSEGDGHTAG